MGLLDDAIREHLELKRLRGADPSEIARAEREALGPVRRAVDPAEESGAEADRELAPEPDDHPGEVGSGYLAADQHDGPVDPAGLAAAIPVTPEHDELSGQPAPSAHGGRLEEGDEWLANEPSDAGSAPHGGTESPPEGDERATQVYTAPTEQPDPLTPPPPASEPRPEDVGGEAIEPEAGAGHQAVPPELRPPVGPASPGVDEPQQAPAANPEGEGGEDVLEETPDFLQETPEHDRLWFEQRPPRDFDFDK